MASDQRPNKPTSLPDARSSEFKTTIPSEQNHPATAARGSSSLFGTRPVPGSQHSTSSNDPVIKILFIGDSSVKKSEFILKFTDPSFPPSFIATTEINPKVKTIEVNGQSVKLHIYLPKREEKAQKIQASYYTGAQGIMLMYDVADRQSFENISNWYRDVHARVSEKVTIYLIGINTAVEEAARKVSTAEGQELASELEMTFFESSISGNINITEPFISLAETALKLKSPATPATSSPSCITM